MEESDDDTICLGESIFVNRDYDLTTFTFGRHSLRLLCLHSASTDYDLTGQVVWPGAVLLNNYLTENAGMLHGCSIIELGSGVGITGILCSRFCREIVLTDHNVEVLEIIRKNIELQSSLDDTCSAGLRALKLEWGNCDQLSKILQEHPAGFDLVLGADISISFQQSSIPPLFTTVEKLLHFRGGKCKFILAYVSRAKKFKYPSRDAVQVLTRFDEFVNSKIMYQTRVDMTMLKPLSSELGSKPRHSNIIPSQSCSMDAMIVDEARKHGMQISEVQGTRSVIANLEGVIFEITMRSS